MERVIIERYENDPNAIGSVRAESGRWQVIIDHENIPHLYVETNVETDDGKVIKGQFCIEDMLPEEMSIQDIMESTFSGKPSPEDEAAAMEEMAARTNKIPCPRHFNKHPSDKDACYPVERLAMWTEQQFRDAYAAEGLPPTDDLDTMRRAIAKLRKVPAAA